MDGFAGIEVAAGGSVGVANDVVLETRGGSLAAKESTHGGAAGFGAQVAEVRGLGQFDVFVGVHWFVPPF